MTGFDAVFNGLCDSVKEELFSLDLPMDLNYFMAGWVNAQLRSQI